MGMRYDGMAENGYPPVPEIPRKGHRYILDTPNSRRVFAHRRDALEHLYVLRMGRVAYRLTIVPEAARKRCRDSGVDWRTL